jgi:acyl carrier protein
MNATLSEKTIARVQDILMEQLAVQRDQVTPEAAIVEDLGADSLDMAEIGMTVEETFNLTMPEAAMESIRTVEDLHEALAANLVRSTQPL